MSYFFKTFRQLHYIARHWKYRYNPDLATKYDIADFIEYAREFKKFLGLRPILITDDGIFIRTVAGFFVWFDPSYEHGILWGVEKNGVWEPRIVELCIKKLQNSGTFLDIGANVGMFSMSIANSLENVSIHAFEPVPTNFSVLKTNLKVNNLETKIAANNLAVGSTCSTINMSLEGQLSHVLKTENIDTSAKIGVNSVSIDYYCETNKITDVKLIKCDVEGFELEVLIGAKKILELQKPSLIIEIEDKWTSRYGYCGQDVFNFLEDFGYIGSPILSNGELGYKDIAINHKLNHSNIFLFECN